MHENAVQRLAKLAAFWNEFVSTWDGPPFHVEFFDELDRINQFQREFPEASVDGVIARLELKILHTLEITFREKEIQNLPELRVEAVKRSANK